MKILITKIVPYKDKDAIINGFNESNNFSILCKGILNPKSRNAAINNPMTYCDIELSDTSKSKYDVLKSSDIIFSPMELIGNPFGLLSINFIGELINKCLAEDEKITLFKSIINSINAIKKGKTPRFQLLALIANILNVSGFSFDVDECQLCGSKKDIVGFSMSDGGFICKNCVKSSDDTNFTSDELLLIRKIFKTDLKDKIKIEQDVDKNSFKKLLKLMVIFIQDNFGLKLDSCELLID